MVAAAAAAAVVVNVNTNLMYKQLNGRGNGHLVISNTNNMHIGITNTKGVMHVWIYKRTQILNRNCTGKKKKKKKKNSYMDGRHVW